MWEIPPSTARADPGAHFSPSPGRTVTVSCTPSSRKGPKPRVGEIHEPKNMGKWWVMSEMNRNDENKLGRMNGVSHTEQCYPKSIGKMMNIMANSWDLMMI
jgi:hypothetical protein